MYLTETYKNPDVVPADVREKYEFLETGSASAVMKTICPDEWSDILTVLRGYELNPQTWMKAGGNRGDVAKEIDSEFESLGWNERRLDIETHGYLVDKKGKRVHEFPPLLQEGYLVDNFKGRVALDVEWNAKDGNLDRDMTAYRTWYESGVIAAGVIITKELASLRGLVERLWEEWNLSLPEERRNPKLPIDVKTSTTTTFAKAELRVKRGVMGTCPLLVVGLSDKTWNGSPYLGDTQVES